MDLCFSCAAFLAAPAVRVRVERSVSKRGARPFTRTALAQDGSTEPPRGRSGGPQEGSGAAAETSILAKIVDGSYRKMAITFEFEGIKSDKYNEALRSFVLGCMAAYTRGVGVGLLMMELAVTKIVEDASEELLEACELSEMEKLVRAIWVQIVYVTLSEQKIPQGTGSQLTPYTPVDEWSAPVQKFVERANQCWKPGSSPAVLQMEMSFRSADQSVEHSKHKSNKGQWLGIYCMTMNTLAAEMSRQ